jgi:hypothetical protein
MDFYESISLRTLFFYCFADKIEYLMHLIYLCPETYFFTRCPSHALSLHLIVGDVPLLLVCTLEKIFGFLLNYHSE